ncbi:MAG: YdeI/OmpD-associated family protein [Chloroflexota bacterium]|nr:YdeI/OmpD-associated family protein [Chloroflexota bacterium]
MADDLPRVTFESEQAWELWLEANHETSPGLWLQIAKKDSGIPSVTYAQALQVALCFGWIDGQKGSLDDRYFLQKFTRRRPKSKWSQVNREHIARLTAEGRMRPAGQREVDAAKADGRWEAAYAPQSTIEAPADFLAALEAQPAAFAVWSGLKSAQRYSILFYIHDAKKPETRAKRIEKYVAMLSDGKTLN